jgi:hypothetical protein
VLAEVQSSVAAFLGRAGLSPQEGDLQFFDDLDEVEQNTFKKGAYPVMRWASTVRDSNLIEQYYLMSANEVNKHFFSLSKHPKLQWLLATCVSPGMGAHKHEWIAFKGKASKNKRANFLGTLYPTMKMSDLELMADEMTDDDVKLLLRDLGWEDKKIKEALK